jgi:nucleoside-diphosphate-sugar epimerase
VIAQCLSESDVIKVGNTAPTRDFTYVKDTSRGIVELLKHSASPGEVFNIGTGSEISISRLIDLIQEIIGTNKSVFQEKERVRPTNSEVLRLVCDSSKLERATGFRAITGLREGLEKTVEWFRLKKTNWYYKGTSFVE